MTRPPDHQENTRMASPSETQHGARVPRVERRHGARRRRRFVTTGGALLALAAIAIGVILYNDSIGSSGPLPVNLPPAATSYLGVYASGLPASYTPVTTFANTTGSQPDIVMYYSGWFVPFPLAFANTAASHSAAPLVQMDPDGISIAEIADGRYDAYLSSYAEAVRGYGHPVILSFGHEMNGNWYSWGYRSKTPPKVFIAAWRHMVKLFRALGAKNVTWLWTVNIINDGRSGKITRPDPWWPGDSYVTWVGIDGYYLKPNWQFAPLFGPTISDIRALTRAPILIAETGAVQTADQSAKVSDLFAGVHAYGLLGLVWFDSTNSAQQDFGLSSPESIAAFHKGASTFQRPGS